MKNGDSVKIQKEYTSVKIDVENSKGEVYRYLIILTRKSGKAGMKAAPGAQSDPEIYITDVGRILRTFKIKKNVEVTDNGKIII